jgi:hypothetical protein
MMKGFVVALVAAGAVNLAAQTTGRGTAQKPAAAAKTASVRISVKDQDGASVNGAHLALSGVATGDYTTGVAGTAIINNLKEGVYRVRCEHEGFVTLEREFTVKGGVYNVVDIALTAAAAPPPPPPPPPPVPTNLGPSGPPVTMSIPDFIDRNYIGREPLKESVLACNPRETVRLLQMREGIARHVHDHVDEIVYVVAGEGSLRIGDDTSPLRAGSLVVVPTGSAHAFERKGKNPLIVVSTLAGSACETPKTGE